MSDSYFITESQLHTAIAMWLDLALPDGAVWQTNMFEARRGWHQQKTLKAHGVRAGWPDIQVVHEGRSYFIELKRPKSPGKPAGRLSKAQEEMHAELRAAGAEVAVCYSLHDVQAFLGAHISLKARAA
jgi:hypothetical protein